MTMVGEYAKRMLSAESALEVLGCTSRAVFLLADEEVLWITGPAAEPHRRAMHAQCLPHWPPGSTVVVEDNELCAAGECLTLERAMLWATPPLPQPAGDFQALARTLLDNFSSSFPAVRATLGPGWWERCRKTLSEANIPEFLALAKERLGRGPGLTPLADDFLGGALFALRTLLSDSAWPDEIVKDFLAWAKGHTHRLGLCLLADLSRGCGPGSLHAFVDALFAGDEGAARDCARNLLDLGQSTGVALLLGALLVWSEFREGASSGRPERAH